MKTIKSQNQIKRETTFNSIKNSFPDAYMHQYTIVLKLNDGKIILRIAPLRNTVLAYHSMKPYPGVIPIHYNNDQELLQIVTEFQQSIRRVSVNVLSPKKTSKNISKRDILKTKTLQSQDGLCAICKRDGSFCAACYKGCEHKECNIQPVNTLDHNHSHSDCKGCEICIRGMTHNICNRALTIIEANPHLQNDYTKEYLNRGLVNGNIKTKLVQSQVLLRIAMITLLAILAVVVFVSISH